MELEKRFFSFDDLGESLALPTENKDAAAGLPTVAGYAAPFGKLSQDFGGWREKIRQGAFANSLKSNVIKMIWNHNSDHVLASTEAGMMELEENARGLKFKSQVLDTTMGIDALKMIRAGVVKGVSIGFWNVKDGEIWSEEKDGFIRELTDLNLLEFSPTGFPAYPQTSISARNILEEGKRQIMAAKKKSFPVARERARLALLDLRIRKKVA